MSAPSLATGLKGAEPRGRRAADGVDTELVARLHRIVGEALTATHASHDEAGRARLSLSDERALARKLLADELRGLAADAYSAGQAPLEEHTEDAITAAVLDRLHGLARLQPLLDDPSIRDIHISGSDRVWLTLREGRRSEVPPWRSPTTSSWISSPPPLGGSVAANVAGTTPNRS